MTNSAYLDAYFWISDFLSVNSFTFDDFVAVVFFFTFAFLFIFFAFFMCIVDAGALLYKKVLKPVFLWQFRKFKAWFDRSGSDYS